MWFVRVFCLRVLCARFTMFCARFVGCFVFHNKTHAQNVQTCTQNACAKHVRKKRAQNTCTKNVHKTFSQNTCFVGCFVCTREASTLFRFCAPRRGALFFVFNSNHQVLLCSSGAAMFIWCGHDHLCWMPRPRSSDASFVSRRHLR